MTHQGRRATGARGPRSPWMADSAGSIVQKLNVAEVALTAPTHRRTRRGRMMNPDPAVKPSRGGFAQLDVDLLLDEWPVPPGTNCEERVANPHAVPIAGDAEFADLADPAGHLLALGTALIEIVIARAQDDRGDAGQQCQILFRDHDLRAEIDE